MRDIVASFPSRCVSVSARETTNRAARRRPLDKDSFSALEFTCISGRSSVPVAYLAVRQRIDLNILFCSASLGLSHGVSVRGERARGA